MEISNLYKYDSYLVPNLNFLLSTYIREYDITKANISILRRYGYINNSEYDKYYNMDKLNRNISIGLRIRDDKQMCDGLMEGFKLSRKEFFEANQIEDHHVFGIKRDAIFLINKVPTKLDFNGVVFEHENTYSSFYKVNNLEMYYYLDKINDISKLDIKGISDEKLKLHENYMIDFLKYIFEVAEVSSLPSDQITILNNFYELYLHLKLEPGYYRELNQQSLFKLNSSTYKQYQLHSINDKDLQYLDITVNMNILRMINSYYSILWSRFIR